MSRLDVKIALASEWRGQEIRRVRGFFIPRGFDLDT